MDLWGHVQRNHADLVKSLLEVVPAHPEHAIIHYMMLHLNLELSDGISKLLSKGDGKDNGGGKTSQQMLDYASFGE